MKSAAVVLALGLALTACSGGTEEKGSQQVTATPAPTSPAAANPTATSPAATGPTRASTTPKVLASHLQVPWGVAFLPGSDNNSSALVAERPTGAIVKITATGTTTPIGTVPGVRDFGEGGLLGLALNKSTLYAYFTSKAGDNRVVQMSFDGAHLGPPKPILTGIPSADHHNGGLVTIGPDGKLWIGTGDAGTTSRAQDRKSLGGKILRLNLDGSIPSDNPFPGSPVYSLGHRNVQGLAFDSSGQPWATEFGQNTWDELNRIVPAGNYGWPEVEGKQAKAGFIEPLVQWSTSEASPSGLAIVNDVAYVGALRGERLWAVPLHGTTTGTPKAYLERTYGRIRTVAATPDGRLWITTSNRDGRGSPIADDDRVIELAPPA